MPILMKYSLLVYGCITMLTILPLLPAGWLPGGCRLIVSFVCDTYYSVVWLARLRTYDTSLAAHDCRSDDSYLKIYAT